MLAALFAWAYSVVILLLMAEVERLSVTWWLGAVAACWMAFAGAMAGWSSYRTYE